MTITGMDRLSAALNGRCSDRVPVFCNLLDQGAEELGMPLRDYYSKGDYVAEAQLAMREKYGYDNLWALFYVGKEAELLGCRKILFAKDGPPNVEDFVVRSPADIRRLAVPDDVAAHPAFEQILVCLRLLRKHAGGISPICVYITAPMALPAILMGMEQWMNLLFLGDPGDRDALLDTCHEFFVKEVRAYRNAGADVLVYSNPFGSTDVVPMKFFLEQSLPWIEKDIRAAGAEGVVYYCGTARINPVLEAVRQRTKLGVYYLGPLEDIHTAKRVLGNDSLTCGVINDIALVDWSLDEIRREVKRIMDAGVPGGRFLFGTGVMPCSISEDRIRAMLEAAYEFGCHESAASHA